MTRNSKNDKVYNAWRKMHVRCYDRSYHSYHRYGGRGIKVCNDWHDYELFKQDMAEDWFDGATVDRENNDGDYEPANCSWKTKSENTKPLKYDLQEMLELYESGMKQY